LHRLASRDGNHNSNPCYKGNNNGDWNLKLAKVVSCVSLQHNSDRNT